MQAVIPTFRITDHARSSAFYVQGLGFKVNWEHRFEPSLPVFMEISRGGMVLYLSQHQGDCQPGGLVHLYVPDVDAWHGDFEKRGVEAPQPQDQPWGNRDFRVTDPDGNQLCICTRLQPA
jgi:uncharacterized glyoxalase superfamily protein PhnB